MRRSLLARPLRLRLRVASSRAFSDAVDPLRALSAASASLASSGDELKPQKVNGLAARPDGALQGPNGALQGPLDAAIDAVEGEMHDIEFTAQRIGFPMLANGLERDNAGEDGENPELDENGEDAVERLRIREESREHATAKAERILALLRHSMTELDIGKVIHRVAQYATLPRVTPLSRKQFLRSLENRFGQEHTREYEYFLAFLQGNDEVLDRLEMEQGVSMARPAEDAAEPAIMGLNAELAADPQFIGIVFCYCRLACLNSLKLVQRPSPGQQRGAKSSLWQVKNDFRKVLDTEGLGQYADLMGLERPTAGTGEAEVEEDTEWQEFNLENDRIDFRMLMAQTEELVTLLKRELPNDTIAKMLITMLASLKTSKLHRKIFQEMVCNLQTAFPEQYHEEVLTSLVPFLSGNNATFADFDDSSVAANTLQHHRMRHEAILRALLECRMRVGHLLIHGIDSVDPGTALSPGLSADHREKVIATAWNLVNVLDDRQYHMFFSRFLKYKLAWRPNRVTFGQTFLDDIRKTLGEPTASLVMPLFEQTYNNLSVETLTICRVKARHAHKLLRGRGALKPLDEAAQRNFEDLWQSDRSVFYRNLPHGVTEKHLRDALAHVGEVERFFLFENPVNGAPGEVADEEVESKVVIDDEDKDLEEDDTPKKKTVRRSTKALKTPRRKAHVIASDTKTKYHALVEFSTPEARDRALMRALQIFGVMMAGWKEYRPVFSSDAPTRTSISIQNIPFGTRMGDLLDEVNTVLASDKEQGALELEVTGTVPRDVMITNGRVELHFDSFKEAAHVVGRLHDHVRFMKSRRPVSGEDVHLQSAKALHEKRRKSQLRRAANEKRKFEKLAAAAAAKEKTNAKSKELFLDAGDDDELEEAEEDEVIEDEDDDDEDEDEYFESELAREAAMTDEQRALMDVPKPFEVTWNPAPRARNKHVYL